MYFKILLAFEHSSFTMNGLMDHRMTHLFLSMTGLFAFLARVSYYQLLHFEENQLHRTGGPCMCTNVDSPTETH